MAVGGPERLCKLRNVPHASYIYGLTPQSLSSKLCPHPFRVKSQQLLMIVSDLKFSNLLGNVATKKGCHFYKTRSTRPLIPCFTPCGAYLSHVGSIWLFLGRHQDRKANYLILFLHSTCIHNIKAIYSGFCFIVKYNIREKRIVGNHEKSALKEVFRRQGPLPLSLPAILKNK